MDLMTNSTWDDFPWGCDPFGASRYLFTAWFIVYLLLLPVFLLVLYIGFHKWKKPPSSASGGLSHSDVFTLNMVAMEMICITMQCVGLYGFVTRTMHVIFEAENVFSIIFSGHMLFHTLTCVERYLAVVHPVTYLRLRGEGGVTVRNISIASVWVLCVFSFGIGVDYKNVRQMYCFILILVSATLVTYFSVYVLCVLTRPKPGGRGGQRKQIDQSKRTTVYTMTAILGVLLMRLIVSACYLSVFDRIPKGVNICLLATISNLFGFPSSLVLPLLFLHRAGKLPGC